MGKILYYVHDFPQLSQSYVWVELQAVSNKVSTDIVAMRRGYNGFKNLPSFQLMNNPLEVADYVRQNRPDVIHSHWLYMAKNVFKVAKATNTPFTIRAHSFDTLPMIEEIKSHPTFRSVLQLIRAKLLRDLGKGFYSTSPWYLASIAHIINHPLCLGILSFPFSRKNLEIAGINGDKIFDCYPVVDFKRFHNQNENGNGIMLAGIIKRKKNMQSYFQLAKMIPEKQFNLYTIGNNTNLKTLNQSIGNPVNIISNTAFFSMPDEYKKHQWLVIPNEGYLSTSGWPIIVAEAQASGVAVCIQNSRSDLKEYVGKCGYFFNNIDEVYEIIKEKPSSKKREDGFSQASKSDIENHITKLFELWKPVFQI